VSKRVRFDLEARMAIKRGFDQIANVAQVTLGPIGGVVALERIARRDSSPEILDDMGTIARRIIEIPGAFENMGAMLARHLAWRVRDEVGDGSATALVIAQAIIAESLRYTAAGHNIMALWHGIRKAAPYVEARLEELTHPLEDPDSIASLAASIVRDEQVGRFIEEIFDIVGPQGFVEVRKAYGMQSDREYVEGVYWDAGWISPYFADKDKSLQAIVQRPYILITDHVIENAPDLIPALEAVRRAEGKGLVVIANDIKGSALNLMVANNARGTLRLLGLKNPRYGDMRRGVLDDIAVITGGRFIRKDAGDMVARVKIDDLGRARHVVCSRATFTIVGTMGSPHAIRERIRELQAMRPNVEEKQDRKNLDERIGKLLGGTAILHVSGQTDAEREHLKELAEGAIHVVRMALQGGVVAGGGSAYIAAMSALDEAKAELREEEVPALNILRQALTAPLVCLARNAGHDPGPALAHVQEAPVGWGFDVISGQVIDMLAAGIVDPLPMARAAWTGGVSVATMAMTTDALVYRSYRDKTPQLEP
jgi:chaperonin GroEL